MCTREYLDQRYSDTMALIVRVVDFAVEGTDPDNGGCFVGQIEEIHYVVPTLSGLANLLGTIIARQRKIPVEHAKDLAREVIMDQLLEKGGMPSSVGVSDVILEKLKARMN